MKSEVLRMAPLASAGGKSTTLSPPKSPAHKITSYQAQAERRDRRDAIRLIVQRANAAVLALCIVIAILAGLYGTVQFGWKAYLNAAETYYQACAAGALCDDR